MKYVTKEIREGQHTGKIVWVCSYSQPDIDKKALRNTPPTECLIMPVSETTKRVYYSENYFAPIGANGQTTKKVISPVDNTGFRSNPGNEIDVFSTKQECIDEWNRQVTAVSERMKSYAEQARRIWLESAEKLDEQLK
jgi:hypothetical protein